MLPAVWLLFRVSLTALAKSLFLCSKLEVVEADESKLPPLVTRCPRRPEAVTSTSLEEAFAAVSMSAWVFLLAPD